MNSQSVVLKRCQGDDTARPTWRRDDERDGLTMAARPVVQLTEPLVLRLREHLTEWDPLDGPSHGCRDERIYVLEDVERPTNHGSGGHRVTPCYVDPTLAGLGSLSRFRLMVRAFCDRLRVAELRRIGKLSTIF